MDIPTTFIGIIILFDQASEYGDSANCWGYAGTNSKALCVEFYNFVKFRMLVNYLIFYLSFHLCVFRRI
jgi:hypothetical protein